MGIEETKCFKEVCEVLGYNNAMYELRRAEESHAVKRRLNLNATLQFAFTWSQTPQGDQFWRDIDTEYCRRVD